MHFLKDLNIPAASSIASVQSPNVEDNAQTNRMLSSMGKEKRRDLSSLDVKQPKKKQQTEGRSQCPEWQERNDHAEPQNADGDFLYLSVTCKLVFIYHISPPISHSPCISPPADIPTFFLTRALLCI